MGKAQDENYKNYVNQVTLPENMKMADRLMKEERDRQAGLRDYDKDMANRGEKAARANDGFVEANKILQQTKKFDIERAKTIAQEQSEQE